MMRCSRNVRLLLAFVAGVCLLGPPQAARADMTVTLTEYNGTTTVASQTFSDNGTGFISFGPKFGDFQFQSFQVQTTSPGTAGAGSFVSDTQMATLNSATGERTLVLSVTSPGFTAPGGPGSSLLLVNDLASSQFKGGSASDANASFVSALDGQSTPSVTLTSTGELVSTANVTWPSGDSSYTVTNTLTLTLGGGGSATLNATTTVATPAPAGVTLAVTGLPFLGLASWRRRRRRKD
jgi:hypothetical protein